MRVVIGIALIITGSVLFTLLLPENTPWIIVSSPLFAIGLALVYSKICELEEDIASLEKKLNEFIKRSKDVKKIH